MSIQKLTWVNNVPTPYRLHLFDCLGKEANTRGIKFEGVFMAPRLPMRHFDQDLSPSVASYEIAPGYQWRFSGEAIHLNLRLVAQLLCRPPDWLVVCGWADPTSALLLLLFRIRPGRHQLLMWCEANPHSMRHQKGVIAMFRRYLSNRASAIVVPGRVAAQTVRDQWKVDQPAFIELPNIVSEKIFYSGVLATRDRSADIRKEWDWGPEDKVLLCCARIDEDDKGIIKFLETVRDLWPRSLQFVLAGTGPDEARLREWLHVNEMVNNVRLVGQMKAESLVSLYAAADAFVLPSVRDPNPLTVVEALWAGLPLLLSTHCGNWPESVEVGKNGWLFDPNVREEVRMVFSDLVALTRDQLRAMGNRSLDIAERRFASNECVSRFFNQLAAAPGGLDFSRAMDSE